MKIQFEEITSRETDLLRRSFETFAKHEPKEVNGTFTKGISKIEGREYIAIRKGNQGKVVGVFRITTEGHLRRIYYRWPKQLNEY